MGARLRAVDAIICASPLTPPRLFEVGAESAMKICVQAEVLVRSLCDGMQSGAPNVGKMTKLVDIWKKMTAMVAESTLPALRANMLRKGYAKNEEDRQQNATINMLRGPKYRIARAERKICVKMLNRPTAAMMRPMYSGLKVEVYELRAALFRRIAYLSPSPPSGMGVAYTKGTKTSKLI